MKLYDVETKFGIRKKLLEIMQSSSRNIFKYKASASGILSGLFLKST